MKISKNFSWAILLVSGVATTGSLFLSIGLGLIPCRYCWFQRIFMYPIFIITLIAIYNNTQYTDIYLTFSAIGGVIAGYQSYIQIFGSSSTCTVSCSTVLYKVGPLSIPNLSFIAFSMILVLSLYIKYKAYVDKKVSHILSN